MSKRDYELIATALRASRPTMADDLTTFEAGNLDGWRDVIDAIANALRTNNPRFDHAKFKAACGYFPQEVTNG